MESPEELARTCKVLSAATRVKLIQLLKDGALCVGAIAARLDVTQGAVSQHLRILRDAELVSAERRGYFIHYRLNPESLKKCRAALSRLLRADADTSAKRRRKCRKERKEPCASARTSARSRTS